MSEGRDLDDGVCPLCKRRPSDHLPPVIEGNEPTAPLRERTKCSPVTRDELNRGLMSFASTLLSQESLCWQSHDGGEDTPCPPPIEGNTPQWLHHTDTCDKTVPISELQALITACMCVGRSCVWIISMKTPST